MKTNIEKYIQDYNICKSSKIQKYKFYGNLKILTISTHKWKDFSMDFVIWLPKSKDWQRV